MEQRPNPREYFYAAHVMHVQEEFHIPLEGQQYLAVASQFYYIFNASFRL